MDSLSSYPYTGEDDSCSFSKAAVVANISNWGYATKTKNETEMQAALYAKGPLVNKLQIFHFLRKKIFFN